METPKPFWIDFPSILKANLLPTWPNLGPQIHQIRLKTDAKMHSILDSIFGLIFGRFWLPTSTPENQLNASGLAFSWFSAFKVDIDYRCHFWCQLGSILLSKIHQHPPKNRFQESSKKKIDFRMDFLAILASFWRPSWSHVGHLSRPRTAQEASKSLPRRLQDASKRPSRRP